MERRTVCNIAASHFLTVLLFSQTNSSMVVHSVLAIRKRQSFRFFQQYNVLHVT